MPSLINRHTPPIIDTQRNTLQSHTTTLDSPISALSSHSHSLSLSPNPSLLSVSPGPSPATSPSMSAQVHSVQEDMSEKMMLNEDKSHNKDNHTNTDTNNHSLTINTNSNNKHTNPLQALLSAAVPSPSNANHNHSNGRSGRPMTQSLRVSVTPIINPVTNNSNVGNVRSFLHQSPTGSPNYHSHSPFMSLSAMSPLTPITTTTASTSSVSSVPHVSHGHGVVNGVVVNSQQHSSNAMPVSPLSVWTPNIPTSHPVLTGGISTASFANGNPNTGGGGGLSLTSIQAQYESLMATMFHELDSLFPLMVKTGTKVNNDSARLDDSTKWLNRAIPLSSKPLRHLANACRLLLDLRKVVFSTSMHVTHIHKTMGLPMPPSLFDSEITQVFHYVTSESYYRSHQLQSLQSIIKAILAHAYQRSTSSQLPLRTNPDDDSKGDSKTDSNSGNTEARLCQSCLTSADVSIVFSCHHTQCWNCLGKAMNARNTPCTQCNTSWLVQRDSAVLDENEALVLAAQYLQSSYSLPTQSPQHSPLLHSHPSPVPLLDEEVRDTKKRKISANTNINTSVNNNGSGYEAPVVAVHQAPMNTAAFHHATSSAFSRRVSNIYTGTHGGASSPEPGAPHHSNGNMALSPQFGSSSPIPGQYPNHSQHHQAWSPAPAAPLMPTHTMPSQFSLIPSSHAQHVSDEQGHPHYQRPSFHPHAHTNTGAAHPLNITVTGPALLSNGIPSMPSPQLQYGFVDAHGNTYPSYPHYSQPMHAGHGYATMPQYIAAYHQATPIPTATASPAPMQPIDAQTQALIKRELKVKKEKKSKDTKKKKKKKKRSKKSESESGSDSGSDSDSDSSNESDNNDSNNDRDANDDGASGAVSGQIYPFLCRVPNCNDSFKTRFSLKRHMKKHTGQKPFTCEYPACRKQFAEKSTLKRHLRIHTGEKPYQCSVPGCGKMFADRTNVKRHEMIHSGERPYWCTQPGCKRGYFWRKHLKKHLLSVHGVVQPSQNGLGNHAEQTIALMRLAGIRQQVGSRSESSGSESE